jgi:hypothetical protein
MHQPYVLGTAAQAGRLSCLDSPRSLEDSFNRIKTHASA